MNYLWTMLKTTFAAWNEHEAPRLGAALAFYTVLSLAPLVIVVIAIGAFVMDVPQPRTNCSAKCRA